MRRRLLWTLAGAVAGAVLAIPASYVIQPGIVRGLYNLGEYCGKVVEELPHALDGGTDLLGCGRRVAVTAAIMGALGAYAGFCLAVRRRRRGY
ncbi:MAG: hypothetical protein ACHRHE_18340 [Tepidisphaerales bacterium]